MTKFNISIPLGSVDLEKLESDEDFRQEAHRLLPNALTQIGEKAAEVAWNELQKGLRNLQRIPGIKVNSSSNNKSRFIRDAGQNRRRTANASDRRAIEDHIIQQLRKMKRKAK